MAHAIYTSFTNLIDSNGVPYSSAKVFVLEAGTTTPKTIYSDSALNNTATNPISVSQGGPHDIRYVAAGTYKIVVETGGGDTLGSGTTQSRYCKDNVDTGVAVGSGSLPVVSGGTGAANAASARTNLGAASSSEVADIATEVAELQDSLTGTDATQLAAGTTAQRPVSPAVGQVRWNSTTSEYESYDGSSWYNIKTSENATSTANVTAETAEDTFIRPDRLKYSQRVAIAWGYVTVSGGTPTMANSFGVSSTITDNGAGDFTFTFSSTQPNSNFSVHATAVGSRVATEVAAGRATTTFRILCLDSGFNGADPTALSFVVFGDFA